jgi:hypothetical protein
MQRIKSRKNAMVKAGYPVFILVFLFTCLSGPGPRIAGCIFPISGKHQGNENL